MPGRYNNTINAHITVVHLCYDKKMDADHVGVHSANVSMFCGMIIEVIESSFYMWGALCTENVWLKDDVLYHFVTTTNKLKKNFKDMNNLPHTPINLEVIDNCVTLIQSKLPNSMMQVTFIKDDDQLNDPRVENIKHNDYYYQFMINVVKLMTVLKHIKTLNSLMRVEIIELLVQWEGRDKFKTPFPNDGYICVVFSAKDNVTGERYQHMHWYCHTVQLFCNISVFHSEHLGKVHQLYHTTVELFSIDWFECVLGRMCRCNLVHISFNPNSGAMKITSYFDLSNPLQFTSVMIMPKNNDTDNNNDFIKGEVPLNYLFKVYGEVDDDSASYRSGNKQ